MHNVGRHGGRVPCQGVSFPDRSTLGFQTLLSELAIALAILIRRDAGLTLHAGLRRARRGPSEAVRLGALHGATLDFGVGRLGRGIVQVRGSSLMPGTMAAPLVGPTRPKSEVTQYPPSVGGGYVAGRVRRMRMPTLSQSG